MLCLSAVFRVLGLSGWVTKHATHLCASCDEAGSQHRVYRKQAETIMQRTCVPAVMKQARSTDAWWPSNVRRHAPPSDRDHILMVLSPANTHTHTHTHKHTHVLVLGRNHDILMVLSPACAHTSDHTYTQQIASCASE